MAFSIDDMLDNAAAASQHLPLIDSKVVRGAVVRSVAQYLQLRDWGGKDTISDVVAELQAHPDWNS
jgi:hypothetical protein